MCVCVCVCVCVYIYIYVCVSVIDVQFYWYDVIIWNFNPINLCELIKKVQFSERTKYEKVNKELFQNGNKLVRKTKRKKKFYFL